MKVKSLPGKAEPPMGGSRADSVRSSGDVPERWSAARKAEIALRLLRGEDLGVLARETQQPAHVLEEWRRAFVEGGNAKLRSRSGEDSERDLVRARAKVGELTMKLELVEGLLEKRGFGDDLKKLGK